MNVRPWVLSAAFVRIQIFWDTAMAVLTSEDVGTKFLQIIWNHSPKDTMLRCKVCSKSRCALRLWYIDLVVSIEVVVEVCCCFAVFSR
jgi:hypothetical protein